MCSTSGVFSIVSEQCARDYFSVATANINSGIGKIENQEKQIPGKCKVKRKRMSILY